MRACTRSRTAATCRPSNARRPSPTPCARGSKPSQTDRWRTLTGGRKAPRYKVLIRKASAPRRVPTSPTPSTTRPHRSGEIVRQGPPRAEVNPVGVTSCELRLEGCSTNFGRTGYSEIRLAALHRKACREEGSLRRRYPTGAGAKRTEKDAVMNRERPYAPGPEGRIPEAWVGREVMIETTEALSSDLRASTPMYLEDVNERGVVMLVTRHRDQNRFSRYFYPWGGGGWIGVAGEGGGAGGRARRAGG